MGDNRSDLTGSKEPFREKLARAGVVVFDQAPQRAQVIPRTYLDHAVDHTVSLFGQLVLGDEERESHGHDEVEKYSKMFLKAVPLFADRKRAVSLTICAFGLDQASPSDKLGIQLTDFTLGGLKGATLKGTLMGAGAFRGSPAVKGMAMGFAHRTVDAGLTRQTWIDATSGEFSSRKGLLNTFFQAAEPKALATDAVLFGTTEFAVGRLNYASKGAFYRHPALPVVASGGIFGLGSGAGEEIIRQKHAKEDFDLSKVFYRAGLSSSVNMMAASVGGLDRMRTLRLNPSKERSETNGPVPERVRRFNEVDSHQTDLKDSPIVIKKQFNDVAYLAEVQTPTGTKQAIFRVTDSPEMKTRYSNELLDYQMHRAMKLGTRALTVVDREVAINGKQRPGYLQELGGRSFEDALRGVAQERFGSSSDRAAAQALSKDPALAQQYEQVWISKLLLQQWDNHAHNKVLHPDGKMSNIDLADPIPAARYRTDYIPSWGKTASRVSLLNDKLTPQLAGKPLTLESRSLLKDFVRDFDSSAGRTALGGAGHNAAQVDGLLGRARYFAEVGRMPSRDMPNLFVEGTLRALYLLRKGQSPRFEAGASETRPPAKSLLPDQPSMTATPSTTPIGKSRSRDIMDGKTSDFE
ncbi:MAG: hypothetical protein K2X93_11815 [Candidatus Obscuribacterales bacterium]|nr:hypothetical protein [Candidatus Obscuribacterales bacterium]